MHFRFATLRDWIARQVIRHVDIWITITEQQRRLLKDQWRIDAPIFVVPNRLKLPVAAATIKPIPADGRRPMRVLFLGRFERNQKGLDWLVTELRRHRSSWLGRLCFVFQGQGEYEQALQQLAQEIPDDAVSIAPWGDVLQEMQRADVLLLPSRFEGFPLVAVEATHYGVPIVASSQAGLADVLPPECIFPFGDFGAMSKALERMRNPLARASAVACAQTRMRPLLSTDRFEQAVSIVTRELAGNTTATNHASAAP
jgi:glycosyltransferase involved in cell wall biosynthesis